MKFVFSLLVMLSSLELSSTQENEAPVYADLVFLVDSSNNMGEKLFNQVKSFISRTISQLPIGVDNYRIGLAHYNDDLKVDFLLSTFKARNPIMNFIKNKFTFQGGPLMTGNALAKVQENFFNENGRDKSMYPPVLVVITSGPSLDDAHSSAAGLKQDNVRIITMGLKDASIDYLEAIATSPSFAFNIENVRDLTSFPKELISAVQNVVQNNYYVPTTQETSTLINTVPVPTTNDVFNVTNNRTAVCDQGLATDVVLMVDTSQHTISESKDLNNFLMNVVSGLKISDYCVHVGLVTYNNKASLIASVDTGVSKSIVEKFVEDIKASKEKISNIGGAINFTHSELFETLANRKSQGIQQIAILITHRSSSDSVSEAAHLLRQENVRVFTVGIAQANETQMAQIASYPTNHYHVEVKTFSDLSTQAEILLKKIMNAVDQDSFVSPEQTDLIRKGCLNTELADIHFLIHGSGSIDANDFTQLKTFLMELVEMFDIGPRKVRVGAVQYSNEIQQEFGIGTEYSKTNLKLALQNIRQLGGGTNTGAAINFTRKFIIDPRNVRAESVPAYLIVLTDGESQDSVKEAAEILRGDNVNVYAIGVKKANRTQLLEITGDHKRVHFVYDFDALKDIKNVIAQQICSPKACQQVEADVMFLVDSSGSIGKDNFNKMKTFMKNLINKTVVAEDKVQFGIVQFSDTSMEVLQLNKKGTKAIIWDAIDKMNYMEQTTYTGKALEFVSEYFTEKKGARPKVKKFLILITDGEAHDEVKRAAQSLRNSGVIIISVGVFNANKNQLVEISGKKELVHYMETFDTLKTIEDELIFGICSPQEECSRIQLADIVFVIDSSGSISAEQYNIMKDFIISMVNKSDVGPNNVQFGALKYSDHPTRLFYLNKHSTKLEIIKAIENDIAKGGDTYTAKALDFSKSFFTEKHGSRHRSGVPQILIIITDGDSHDRERLNETSRSLQEAGITLYAIGVAKALTEELKTMAGSKGKWFFVENFYGLNDIFMNVSQDVCNRTECKEDETDIIFLVDGSTSILTTDFEVMKNFMVSVVDDFDIGPNKVHVGIAQYSDAYQPEFKLKTYMDKETLKDNIGNITQIFGNTLIGKALTQTNSDLFIPSNNSRINEGVNQILLVITDGNSQDEVAKPAEALRKRGINIYAVGVGQVSETQLIQIAGSPEKKMSVNNFNELKTIKQRIVRAVCTTPTANNCTVDVIVGFDISTYQNSAKLFHGQNQLKAQIANILNSMMNVKSASCSHGVKPQISVAFYMPNAETHIKTSGFNIYSPDIVRNLETSDVNSPSYLTSHDLQSMWETLRKNNTGKAKMLLVFTDGLDENVEELEKKVEELQRQGLNALVTVALEGTKDDDIKYIEFGRGFEYNYQLHIGMPDIGDRLAKQMSHVAEKTCCCVFCKCTGESGMPGIYGLHGTKGLPGIKGNQGHSGEEGGEGERGLPGSMGGAGDKGCSGTKGPKGNRGIPGNTNEDGESGLDGIPGELGNSGPTGIKGEMGETGEAGSPGIRGAPGHRGYKGLKGDTGEPGTNSTIPGPKGLRGDPGIEGESGLQGPPGKSGAEGIGKRPGRKAATGPQGIKGVPAEPGFTGDEGLKGPQGDEGIKGIKGEKGRNGLNGLPGSFGVVGSKGNPGNPGAKGKKGELGDPGAKGNPGQEGLRGLVGENGKDDFGAPGKIGIKGQRGFPGDIGVKGEQGDPGITGEHGPKGVPGISISSEKGDIGDPGRPGYRGRRGRKGIKGPATQSPCELIDFIRKTCPCYQGKPACPVYPTELVFSLDMANDVTPAIYTRMTDIVTSILDNINIRENNCPVGARIAVVSYNTYTKYLVRFSDFQSKDKLLKAVKNIPLEKSTRGCDIGSNMRFVARNIFKRSLQGATVRRIAVFFTNGKSDDAVSINTAVMEYNALGIIPAVIAFTPAPAIKKAFSVDDTGRFQLIIIPANVDFKPLIKTLETCTLCYDRCKPDTLCVKSKPLIQKSPIDIGFLLDSSYNVRHSDFEEARSFISTVIDRLDISSTGDRVALVSNTPPGFSPGSDGKPHLEFDLSTYNNQILMKKHLQESTHHLQGPPALGFTLKWTIDNIMSKAPNLRKHKAIIIILSGETSGWDKPTLRDASLKAKCQGYALFVLFIGQTYNNTELLDLASSPIEHHLLQLGRIHKPDFGYALGFIQSFLNSIRLSINKYPPPELKSKCSKLNNTRGKRITSPRDETEGESFHHKKSIWRSGDKSGSSNGMEAPTSLERGPLAIDPVKPYTEQSLSNFSGNREKK